MTNLAIEAAYGRRRQLRRGVFKRRLRRVEARVGEDGGVQRLSLSSGGYLYERDGAVDRQQASEATEQRSLRVLPGQLVVNPMWLTGGSIAVSRVAGAVSPDYRVFELDPSLDPRFLHHLLRSQPYRDQYNLFVRANTTFDRRIQQEDLDQLPLWLPDHQEQRRIADFLDDRVARIDRIIAARRSQMEHANAASLRDSFDTVRGSSHRERRPSGLAWLGTIPRDWALRPVNAEFQVDLGKMLDEKRQSGLHAIPYLRNTNVQWDRVDLADLKSMDITPDERPRYTVEPGDLLICEGGQPGRAAIWPGGPEPLGFQKALHRARSRGNSRPEWLLECLRAATALNVFAVEYEQATIGHLTNEQLRSFKVPCPELQFQDEALAELRITQERARLTIAGFARSIDLLNEYKESLITAAVTGELDVTTAGSGIPG